MKRLRTISAVGSREFAALAVAAAVFVVFSNCLSAGFLWDDAGFVWNNAHLASWSTLPSALTESVAAGAGQPGYFFRPVQTLTHFLDLRVWGTTPWGHHLTSVALQAAASASVFYWLAGFAAIPEAALAALIYGVHPLQTEAVAYVSGRGDTLAVLFTCAGLALFFKRPRWALVCALLAMLSKENAVMFPALLWLHAKASGKKFEARAHAPFWALAAAYAGSHLAFFAGPAAATHSASFRFSSCVKCRLFTFLTTLPEGLRLWLWPSDLHHERFWAARSSFDAAVAASAAGLALWFGAIAALRRKAPAAAAGMAWFVVATLPTSNLIVMINALFYDHWFLYPGLGLALALTQVPTGRGPRRAAALACGLAAAVACAAKTRELNAVWHDSYSLNSYILRYEPDNPRIRNNLGAALAARGQWESAIEQLRVAIALDDEYPAAHHNLGKAYEALGRDDEAAVEFRRALAMNPNLLSSRVCLGWLELQHGRRNLAERIFADTVRARPYAPSAWLGLAEIRLDRGDRAGAREDIVEGRRWNPDDDRLASALDRLDAGAPAADIDRTWADSVRY